MATYDIEKFLAFLRTSDGQFINSKPWVGDSHIRLGIRHRSGGRFGGLFCRLKGVQSIDQRLQSQQDSLFFILPPELRFMIYNNLISPEIGNLLWVRGYGHIDYEGYEYGYRYRELSKGLLPHMLMATCVRIYLEFVDYLRSTITFRQSFERLTAVVPQGSCHQPRFPYFLKSLRIEFFHYDLLGSQTSKTIERSAVRIGHQIARMADLSDLVLDVVETWTEKERFLFRDTLLSCCKTSPLKIQGPVRKDTVSLPRGVRFSSHSGSGPIYEIFVSSYQFYWKSDTFNH